MSALLDDPRIDGIAMTLLGGNFNYMGSDGNYYTGNTPWHRDGEHRTRRHLKIAFYLDQLVASTGALRVIPGSHKLDDQFGKALNKTGNSAKEWSITGDEVPAVSLDTVPGDILVFDHNTLHSSWGGNNSRRMFTINLSERFSDSTIDELAGYITTHGHYHRDHYYGPAMRNNAGPGRVVHKERAGRMQTFVCPL